MIDEKEVIMAPAEEDVDWTTEAEDGKDLGWADEEHQAPEGSE